MIGTSFVVRNREVGVIFEVPTMMHRGTTFALEHPLYLSPNPNYITGGIGLYNQGLYIESVSVGGPCIECFAALKTVVP